MRSPLDSPLRRILLPALVLAPTLALASAPAALAGILTPQNRGGSPNAEKIHTLYLIALVIGFLIFLLVEGVLIYSLVKFRFRRGMPAPAQVGGDVLVRGHANRGEQQPDAERHPHPRVGRLGRAEGRPA